MKDKKIILMLFSVTFGIVAIMGLLLNVAIVLDETGVVANAAYIAGYNWHDWVTATGRYYYKYGLALLYIPILCIFNNPYVIYKLIMVVNAFLVAIPPVCAFIILRRHLGADNKKLCALMSFAVGIIPSSVLYSLSGKADVALISVTWLVLLFILESATKNSPGKSFMYSCLIAISSMYMYMCHTRGIVFVIAASMTVVFIRIFMKNKNVKLIPYALCLVAMWFVDKKLTAFFKHGVWGRGKLRNTMANLDTERYKKMASFTGIETVIKTAAGWFFDSIIGTYGLVIAGLFIALLVLWLYLRKKDISEKEFIVSLYGALAYGGTMALGILFFFKVNFKLAAEYTTSRVDRLFYSRYMSPGYGIIILIALYFLFIRKDVFGIKTKIFVSVFSILVVIFVGTWVYDLTYKCNFSWRNVLDCGMFLIPPYFGWDAGSRTGRENGNALMLGAVLGLLVLFIILFASHNNRVRAESFIWVVCACFFVNMAANYVKLRFNADMRTMNVCGGVFTEVEKIVDIYEDVTTEYHDLYYDSSESAGYKFYQMGFPNFSVHVKGRAKFEQVDDAFIIARSHVINEDWYGDDCYLLTDYDYDNNVNAVIIKGEKLKASLEEHGIKVYAMPENYADMGKIPVPGSYLEAVKNSFNHQINSLID